MATRGQPDTSGGGRSPGRRFPCPFVSCPIGPGLVEPVTVDPVTVDPVTVDAVPVRAVPVDGGFGAGPGSPVRAGAAFPGGELGLQLGQQVALGPVEQRRLHVGRRRRGRLRLVWIRAATTSRARQLRWRSVGHAADRCRRLAEERDVVRTRRRKVQGHGTSRVTRGRGRDRAQGWSGRPRRGVDPRGGRVEQRPVGRRPRATRPIRPRLGDRTVPATRRRLRERAARVGAEGIGLRACVGRLPGPGGSDGVSLGWASVRQRGPGELRNRARRHRGASGPLRRVLVGAVRGRCPEHVERLGRLRTVGRRERRGRGGHRPFTRPPVVLPFLRYVVRADWIGCVLGGCTRRTRCGRAARRHDGRDRPGRARRLIVGVRFPRRPERRARRASARGCPLPGRKVGRRSADRARRSRPARPGSRPRPIRPPARPPGRPVTAHGTDRGGVRGPVVRFIGSGGRGIEQRRQQRRPAVGRGTGPCRARRRQIRHARIGDASTGAPLDPVRRPGSGRRRRTTGERRVRRPACLRPASPSGAARRRSATG